MFKYLIRKSLYFLHLDITKNLRYDRYTQQVMARVIKGNSNCIDVGCHKGEMLDLILKYAPGGTHFAFEPIPDFYASLKDKYGSVCSVYPYALSDKPGETSFQYVTNAPAYSGIKKRKYAIEQPAIEQIKVRMEMLDQVVPAGVAINFIKIDVEGAEFGVLKGAKNIIQQNQPFIVFEFGLGASDYYGTKPEEIYRFLVDDCHMRISNLGDWLKHKDCLSLEQFKATYAQSLEYYFIAHPA